jgi:hypothetical protein
MGEMKQKKNDTAIRWVWGIGFVVLPATVEGDGWIWILLLAVVIVILAGMFREVKTK